ncbi:Scaffolding protein [Stenotrophomonas maltophilia]
MQQPDNAGQQSLAANELEMTEGERAALASADGATAGDAAAAPGTPDAAAAATATATPAGDGSAAPAAAAPADGSAQPDAAAAAAAAAAAEGATPAAPAASEPPPATPFVPTYAADERDYGKEISEINGKLQALKEKYKAGDVEDEVYEQQYEDLRDERSRVERAQDIATLQQQLSQQNADQSWAYLQRQFLSRPENAAIAASPIRFAAWEQAMQSVVNDAAASGRQLTDWDILAGARDLLVTEGLLQASAAATAPPVAQAPAKPDRSAPLGDVPATLSTVPAAADPTSRSTADAAAGMDNIEDIESFLAGKSESERDRILRDVPGSFVADN